MATAKSIVTTVPFPGAPTVLLEPNQLRRAASFCNVTSAVVVLKMGTGVLFASFTVSLLPGAYFELQLPAYTGQVEALATGAGVGSIMVTEYIDGF